jgi:hypothetical protein
MQNVGDLRAGGRYLEAAVGLVAIHLYLLAHHSWPAEVETRLREALDLAHEKPWRELADLLWNHAHATAGSFGSHGERGGDDEADAPTDAAPRYATVGYPA